MSRWGYPRWRLRRLNVHMDIHPGLTTTVYVLLVIAALLVITYWVLYTRRLKTARNVGTCEGIAMATQQKERAGRTGRIG
jgi:hypothetical protein